MTSKTGAAAWRAEYDPFGQILSEIVTVSNSKKFTGYERDNNSSATGLDYSMFRYHSSYWGRFQTPDPFGGSYDLTDPQSFNRYSYVENDPINFTDPLGLFLPGPANDPGPTLNPYGCYDLYVDGIYIGKIGACGGSPVPAVDIGGDVGGGGPEPAPNQNDPCANIPKAPPGVDINKNIAEAQKNSMGSAWNPLKPVFDLKGAVWFYNKVKPSNAESVLKGESWDYKRIGKVINGKNEYEDFGNFNYGATGLAVGFDERTLLREAGRAQPKRASKPEWGYPGSRWNPWGGKPPYGDDPNDQEMIKRGFEYYKAGCHKK